MRSMLVLAAVLFPFLNTELCGQTNAAAPAKPSASSPEAQALSILTPDQQMEYAKAHEKALTDNPALKAEGDSLKQQYVTAMTSGTPAQKQAVMQKVDMHRLKLRQAMLKEDPKLAPVFTAIDKYISEAKAKAASSSAAH